MTDLQTKYQKLAAEYSKLRAQVPVLKKAVLDEQANEEQLKESVKEKDQSIRKYEQEVDSLTFRNQQLSSRVAILQHELDEANTRGKKQKKNAVSAPPDTHENASIIDEELRGKIEENARLHRQVYETEEEHRNEMISLQSRLSILEAEAAQHEGVLNSVLTTNGDKIKKLQEDKAMLEVKLFRQEKETREATQRSNDLDEQLRTVETELREQLEEALLTVQLKVSFNDTRDRSLNSLNVPSHNHQHQLQARELIGQANSLLRDLVQGYSDYCRYSEDRARLLVDGSEALGEVNKQLCQHLHGHMSIIKSVKQSFQVFHDSVTDDMLIILETACGLQDFSTSWHELVVYAQTLLPFQLKSLEEECALSSCPAVLSAKNMELHGAVKQFTTSLEHVDSNVSLLAAQSSISGSHVPVSDHAKMFEHLSKALAVLNEATKNVSRHFNAKVTIEHRLPTATQKLKVTDECILSAIISLVTCTSKISAFVSGNLVFLTKSVADRTGSAGFVPASPSVTALRQRAVNYLAAIASPPAESVPYAAAVQNRKTVYSFMESKDSLTQQVVALQERLNQLEQEREQWVLEMQLMQMKYQKEFQKVSTLQRPIGGELSKSTSTGSIPHHSLEGAASGSSLITTSLLGRVDVVEEAGAKEGEADQRERHITSHYTQRITELTTQLQTGDSKALHFFAECRALQKRMCLACRDKDKMRDELTSANQSLAQLKDELQTTTRSYEGQLSMMSEHLAGMNEQLTTQKDEIDILRYQLQQQQNSAKVNKKGKPGR